MSVLDTKPTCCECRKYSCIYIIYCSTFSAVNKFSPDAILIDYTLYINEQHSYRYISCTTCQSCTNDTDTDYHWTHWGSDSLCVHWWKAGFTSAWFDTCSLPVLQLRLIHGLPVPYYGCRQSGWDTVIVICHSAQCIIELSSTIVMPVQVLSLTDFVSVNGTTIGWCKTICKVSLISLYVQFSN